jgi:AcrR family transcriptional regulator
MKTEPGDHGGQRLRADAQRNRDQLLAAARTIFVEAGTNVPMELIAQEAGVGVGTLYRRFPDRHALIQAVAIDSIQRLTQLGELAWEAEPDAWSALRRFVHGGGDLRLVLAAVRPHLLHTVRENHELQRAGQAWYDLLARMVEGARADGVLRPDIGPGDIALMLNQLTRPLPGLPTRLADVLPDRFVDVMLDGLRAQPATPLSGDPIHEWWP